MQRIVIWHNFFGDLSQSEKLSEIKLPLGLAIDFFKLTNLHLFLPVLYKSQQLTLPHRYEGKIGPQ